jgi:hypothetical protein
MKIGDKVGHWTIVGITLRGTKKDSTYSCVCMCGCHREVAMASLDDGKTQSCGCRGMGWKSKPERSIRTGISKHPMYHRWLSMIARCSNDKNHAYADYGGRGIRVCDGLKSHPSFITQAIGNPSHRMSLDRKDNDGHYSCGVCSECLKNKWPLNIGWNTQVGQCRNKRNSMFLEIDGVIKPLKQWTQERGINYIAAYKRIKRGLVGEAVLKEVTPSKRVNASLLTINNKTQSVTEWSREIGVPTSTIHNRILNGWEGEAIIIRSLKPGEWNRCGHLVEV